MIHVLIAEPRPGVRSRLAHSVERAAEKMREECMVSATDDGITAFRKAKRVQPNVILIDSSLPLSGGVQLVRALQYYAPRARIVLLAEHDATVEALMSFVLAGVHAVLPSDHAQHELERILEGVLRGERIFAA